MDANKLRIGHKILIEGKPYKVMTSMLRHQSRQGAKVIVKLLGLLDGTTFEKTFNSGDQMELADIHYSACQYIYNDGDNYIFMDIATSDQFEFPKDKLGDTVKYLLEGLEVAIVKFGDLPIDIELPVSLEIVVDSTEPAIKGDSVNNVMKTATLETGYEIKVPLFINSGEKIIVNTETGEYKGRA